MRCSGLVLVFLLVACGGEGSLLVDVSQLADPRHVELFVFSATTPGEEELLCEELVAGRLGVGSPALDQRRRISFRIDEAAPALGHLPAGRFLFFASVRSGDPVSCPIVGTGCTTARLEDGERAVVEIVVEPLPAPVPCPPDLVCDDGACLSCATDGDCDDGDDCTTDSCVTGACTHAPIAGCTACSSDDQCDDEDPCTRDICDLGSCTHSPDATRDADSDGHVLDRCGGDDCDDDDPLAFPGAERRCGHGADSDCDGTIDDEQGCSPCAPTELAAPVLLGTIDVAANNGIYVVGADPDGARPATLYAVAPTGLHVVQVSADGSSELLASVAHGANAPLPPVVAGDYVLLLESGSPYALRLFSRSELAAGGEVDPTVIDMPPWGRPYSVLVSDGVLYFTTRPNALWAIDLSELPDVEAPTTHILSGAEAWRHCTDMARVADYLLCLEPFSGLSSLSLVELTAPGRAQPFRQFDLEGGEPPDMTPLVDADGVVRLGVAMQDRGLTVIEQATLELPEADWTEDFQGDFAHTRFPAPSCTDTETCEWVTRLTPFGATAALALTRDDHVVSPGTLRLYVTDLTEPLGPVPRSAVAVAEPDAVPAREEHLWASGSLAFVATTRRGAAPAVVVYGIDCDGP